MSPSDIVCCVGDPGRSGTGRGRILADGALLALLALVVPVLVLRTCLLPTASTQTGVAVVFAPWTSAHDAAVRATAAEARLVRQGTFGFIVVVRPDRLDYPGRILAEGALFALDPLTLAACAPGFLPPETDRP